MSKYPSNEDICSEVARIKGSFTDVKIFSNINSGCVKMKEKRARIGKIAIAIVEILLTP